jgi:hypothetical protein
VTNTVLRGTALASSAPLPSVVVESTTLVTVFGASSVVLGALVDAVVVAGVADADADVVDGASDVIDEVTNVVKDGEELVVVSSAITLLSPLGKATFGTKMRGGIGGTNGTALVLELLPVYIVFVTMSVVVTVLVLVLMLVAGAQAKPDCCS